jgi:hypothetical protein
MKRIWYRIVQWVKENLTLARLRLIGETITDPPYDYCYLLRLERAKLQEMANYFSHVDFVDHTRDIYWINICIRLIDIITDDETTTDTPKVNTNNMWRFININRIRPGVLPSEVEDYYKAYPSDLRQAKANALYYEIRKQYTQGWWD